MDIFKEMPYIKNMITVVKNSMQRSQRRIFVNGRLSDAFVYIIEGECSYFFSDGKEFLARSGNVLYLAKNAVYEMKLQTENYSFIYVDFTLEEEKLCESMLFNCTGGVDYFSLFKKLYVENKNKTLKSKVICMRRLYDIYIALCEENENIYVPKTLKEKMEKVQAYMSLNYSNQELSVTKLAEDAQMSEVYFRKIFQSIYKISPKKYLTKIRLEKAIQFMEYSFLSLEKCASMCGFSSWQYFSRVFKNETGKTPAAYRKMKYGELKMGTEIKLFASCVCRLSESPMWNKYDKRLYWRGLDGEIFRKKADGLPNNFEKFELGIGSIGSMVFTETEDILLFGDNGKIWKWKPYQSLDLYKDVGGSLFNDVLCDSKGRIYCGMLAENYFDQEHRGKYGSFWVWDSNGDFICLDNKISATPNGIRINKENDKLYFALTDDGCVYSYDYNVETGELSNRQIFAENCCPDGIAIDDDGNVWVTNCDPNDSKLICYSKEGVLLKEWNFPVRRITSVAFGGENNKTIFVTTAHEGLPKGTYDGGVFFMEADTSGVEEYKKEL